MALHGDLKIDGVLIGAWSTRRADEQPEHSAYLGYEWTAVLDEHEYAGVVQHRPSDGAPYLAGLVLEALDAEAHAAGRPVASAERIPAQLAED